MENGEGPKRIYLNCGLVVNGPAAEIDKLLDELPLRGIRIIYKTAGLKKYFIREEEG